MVIRKYGRYWAVCACIGKALKRSYGAWQDGNPLPQGLPRAWGLFLCLVYVWDCLFYRPHEGHILRRA